MKWSRASSKPCAPPKGGLFEPRRERALLMTSRRRLALGFAALALALGCSAQREIESPPPAPKLAEPAASIPADLDLVVRLDLKRLRGVLGIAATPLLEELGRQAPSDAPDRATAELGRKLFLAADTIWVGVRPGLAAELTDSVVVLRGDFRDLVPRELGGEPAWAPAEDLGGAVRRFTRPPPRLRAAPAVLYAQGSELVVLGSVAEIDALERSVEQGRADGALRAPENGLFSAALRVRALRRTLAQRSPTLGRLVEDIESVEASVDHDGDKFRARVDLATRDSAGASVLAEGLGKLRGAFDGPLRRWLDRIDVQPLAADVALTLDLTLEDIQRVVACWQRANC
jgi:hypothetical protein